MKNTKYALNEGQLITLHSGRPETLLFVVEDEAKKLVANLTDEERTYATDSARGEYRGFAALHDLCDANMILPGAESLEANDEVAIDFWNAVMDRVTEILCAS